MDIVTIARIAILLTFLMTVITAPWAIIKLYRFIAVYERAHNILQLRMDRAERRLTALEETRGTH